jgi:DNA-binding GntR family transcriptional regulator
VQHYLAPGTKLREEALGEIFGVSRTLIHSALVRLAHDGIVELQPNRGAAVARPSIQETREVFAVRRLLECAMVKQICASGVRAHHVRELRDVVKAESRAQILGDRRTQLRLSGEFHLQVAKLTDNSVLHNLLKDLISRSSLAIAVYQAPGTSGCRCDDHAELLDALTEGDGAKAASRMSEHLSTLENGLDLQPEEASNDLKVLFQRIEIARTAPAETGGGPVSKGRRKSLGRATRMRRSAER